ncbi:MAG: GeoRSP system radical SAM/SPASM protein [Deltaproteobacteria bacterium]|nr:GeoRSP system radical SAM/SPASM protein [Deltaproteobacteria bacterium]
MRNSSLPSAPLIINWTLTNQCNFCCQHCYSRADTNDDLDTDTILRLIEKAANAKVLSLNFGGGEPLLREDLFEIIRFATDLGLAVSMNSNGFIIDRQTVFNLKASGIKKVGISIDSPKAAVHDAFRKTEQSHARALYALVHLNDAGIETSVSSVICKINSNDLQGLMDMAISVGASSINFHDFKCSGLGYTNRSALDLDPGQWHEVYQDAVALKESVGELQVMIDDPIVSLIGHKDAESLVKGSVCGKLSLCIKADGAITPCGFIPTVIGNLIDDDLLEVWRNSPVLEAMRNKHAQGKCAGCSCYEDCLGGCSARALALTGDFNNPDPHCWYDEHR